jgi:Autotransporter beta-domain
VPGASLAGTNNGIDFTAGTVTNSGSIASAAFGFTGITATTSATVTNSGTISGTTFGIDVSAGSATVTNSGTIRGTGTPFSSAITATTVASVTNSGTISASFYGIDAGSVAVVVNSGTISENRVGGAAIEAPTAIVTNSGTISAGSGAAGVGGTTVFVINSGTISGGTGVAAGGGTGAVLINSGTITGTNGTAIDFSGVSIGRPSSSNDVLSFLPGSRVGGLIDLGVNDTVNFGGGSWHYTFGGPNGLAGAIINTGGAPFVVSGNQVAVVDPTSFAMADKTVMDFTRAISGLIGSHLGETGTSGGPTAFAPQTGMAAQFDDVFSQFPGNAYAGSDAVVFKNPTMTLADGRSVWASGFYGQRVQDADGPILRNVTGYYGGAIGADGLLRPDLRLGGFIGGGNTSTVIDFNSGSAASDILFAGTYGRYKLGDAFLDFVVQGGHSQNSTIRNINNNLVAGGQETATASFGGWFISPELAFGERFALPDNWSLTPAARVRYVAAEFAGFTEAGSTANLTVGDRMLQDIEERGDLTLTHTMTTASWGQSSLSIHAGVLGLQRTGGDSVNAILLGEALAFATPGKSNVGGVYVGGGFEWCALQRVAVFATGEYVAMSDSSSTVTGNAGLRVGF